jgi:NADPH-dependent 2,4-dienoyl-CoA reductase/sulfur reductase-like enzyme/rhodanese-related sulfurtransferase
MRVVVIGGVALGPKVASRVKRLDPSAHVTVVDAGALISYGGCGIPYYVSGDVADHSQLQETSFHMIRDVEFFRTCKDVLVRTQTRALAIDRKAKTVRIQGPDGTEEDLPYDKLVLATGSTPRQLPIDGRQLPGVFTIANLEAAIHIKNGIAAGKVNSAVIVGAGFIGLEMAEALTDMWGIETSVIEVCDQVLPGFISPILARMAKHHMEEKGVHVYTGEKVLALEGEGKVERVRTDQRTIPADMVILAVGVVPNDTLAREAGLTCHERGGIIVTKTMQTSDPNIYAGGDCVVVENRITGKPGYYPLGSLANRQGRVIGTNVAGGRATFDGAVGTFILKLFDLAFSGTGLSLPVAQREGFDAMSTQVIQFDHAHFFPKKDLMVLEIVVERGTGRVLGIQGACGNGDSLKARIDAVAAMLPFRPSVHDISNMEVAYSPPYAAAMDILNMAANAAENILAGRCDPISPDNFMQLWAERDRHNILCIDCREWGNAEPYVTNFPDFWKNIPQGQLRERMSEVPQDKKIILICNTGGRSYEAQRILKAAGRHDTLDVPGGVGLLRLCGLDPCQD